MAGFFDDIWTSLKKTISTELQDLSYMEIITATSDKVDGHLDNKGWDVLDSLRRGKPPSHYGSTIEGERDITEKDMLNMSNVKILARTRIELDGDVFFLLKSENGKPTELSKEVMEFHKLGIEVSVKNWEIFLRFVVEMAEMVGTIVGDPSIIKQSQKKLAKTNN